MQVDSACAIDHVRIETLRGRIAGYDGEQWAGSRVRDAIESNSIDMPWKAHLMLHRHLIDARCLETELDQPRRDRERLARVVIVGKTGGHLTNCDLLVPPRALQHAVGRAVEV